jgi:hypothetical protein
VTGDSTPIADRVPIGAGPFAHRRRVQVTAPATPSRHRRPIGGFRGRAGCTGSTTRSQPPACSGELIEMQLAQVEFVAGRAVVHSNRRHGLCAVTVKIAGQHDPCCLSHNISVQRHTSDRLLARIQDSNDRSIALAAVDNEPRLGSLAEKHGQVDNDLVEDTHGSNWQATTSDRGESPRYRRPPSHNGPHEQPFRAPTITTECAT